MDDQNRHELEPLEERLRKDRGELSGIELDRIKTGVLARSARQGGRGMALKSRLALVLMVVGLVGTGGGAVIAASGGSSSNGSSANSQYCPPSSPGAGKPKHQGGGNKCGQPEDCDEAGNGNGGNGDNGNGKNKGKGNDDKDKDKKDKCKDKGGS
jgi:hypothetical protein